LFQKKKKITCRVKQFISELFFYSSCRADAPIGSAAPASELCVSLAVSASLALALEWLQRMSDHGWTIKFCPIKWPFHFTFFFENLSRSLMSNYLSPYKNYLLEVCGVGCFLFFSLYKKKKDHGLMDEVTSERLLDTL
jgi:hypothetical protein